MDEGTADLAIVFMLASYKLLADNTLRVSIDIEPRDTEAFLRHFHERGDMGALVRLSETASVPVSEDYGQQAQQLRQSGFFRTPDVWRAIGTDDHYQAWCRTQKCTICGQQDRLTDTGENVCEYAHVRRAGEAGMAYKPPYRGVPLCHYHHSRQHQVGEVSVLIETGKVHGKSDPQAAHLWWDRQVIQHLERWAWETLKLYLGYDSYKHIPPDVIYTWAQERDLVQYLPDAYLGQEN